LVIQVCDVLRISGRRGVQVLDPLRSDDHRRTRGHSAPDHLGKRYSIGDIQGVVYDRVEEVVDTGSSSVVLSFYSCGATSDSTSFDRRPTSSPSMTPETGP
jgi:hypothetical protein